VKYLCVASGAQNMRLVAKIHILVCDVSNLAILDHQPGFRILAPGVRLPLRVKLLLGVFAPSKRIP
jgi:hypothetical protein